MKPFAFVFPGQGSQAVGMLDAWGDHPAVKQVVAEASEALSEDIGRLIQEGPKEALALTTNTHLNAGGGRGGLPGLAGRRRRAARGACGL